MRTYNADYRRKRDLTDEKTGTPMVYTITEEQEDELVGTDEVEAELQEQYFKRG